MKVAVYARVSTDQQEREGTVGSQLFECYKFAEANGWEVTREYLDEGWSGATALRDRPAGARLLADAAAQRGKPQRDFEAILFAALDRLGRDQVEWGLAERELNGLNIPPVYVREAFLDSSPTGIMMKQHLASFAQWEKALIAERTTAGRHRVVRERAKYMAPTPAYGYRRDEEGRAIIHEPAAEVVRRVFQMCADENLGLEAIARRLDDEGILPPMATATNPKRRSRDGKWAFSTINKMIVTPGRYDGTAHYTSKADKLAGRLGTPMQVPAIVTPVLAARARAALKRRAWDSTKNRQAEYILHGLLACGYCRDHDGETVRFHGRVRGGEAEYQCSRRRSLGPQAGHAGFPWVVREAEILPELKQAVDDLIADPAQAIADWNGAIERQRAEMADTPHRIAELERRLAAMPEQERRIADAYRQGILSGTLFEDQLKALRTDRKAIETELTEAQGAAADAQLELETLEWTRDFIAPHGRPRARGQVFDEALGDWVSTDTLTAEEWTRRIRSVISRIWIEQDCLRVEGPGDVVLCRLSSRGTHNNAEIRYSIALPAPVLRPIGRPRRAA